MPTEVLGADGWTISGFWVIMNPGVLFGPRQSDELPGVTKPKGYRMLDRISVGKNVRLGRNVVLTGSVDIGANTSIWHNVVVRGDVAPIAIGSQCNIQDGTVIHGQLDQWKVSVGSRVSVGHSCILHGCELESECFVGMGSIVMNGCHIGRNVMIAAGSLIPEGTRIVDENVLVMGRPGKIVRELNAREIGMIRDTPDRYVDYANRWLPPMEG